MTDLDKLDVLAAAADYGDPALTWPDDDDHRSNGPFVRALVNAYRDGRLVAVEDLEAAKRDKAALRDQRDAAVEERDRLRAAAERLNRGAYVLATTDEGETTSYVVPAQDLDALRAALHPEDGT